MTAICGALSNIINGKSGVCCLCLKHVKEEPIRISDDVVVDINNENCDTSVEDVIKFVFDDKMYNYIATLNSICGQCMKLAVKYYKFIKTCHKNAEYLNNVINEISNSFEYTVPEFGDCNSLFVSLNVQDFTSKHCYDSRRTPSTAKAALRRFHSLEKIKKINDEEVLLNRIKNEDGASSSHIKRRSKNTINIPIADMVDKNNTETLKCKECPKEFPTAWNLRSHYIRVHAPKTFKCPDCPRTYGSAAFLESHRKQSHCTVVCSECGKTFYNGHTLKMHELGHHLQLVCQVCGRVYKNKATFKKHIEQNVCGQKTRAHPSEAKFTCDYCNKKYTQKMSLRVHIQYEHGNYKAHICEWCGKRFWAQSRLKAHIVKHTREKKFPCDVCGGRFVSKESLLYHTRTHTGEKPYKCPHCEVRFLSSSRRSEHVKRHHLGGTLECDECHSKFNTRAFLQKHKKSHKKHLTYDIPKGNTSKPKANHAHQSKNKLTKLNLSLNNDVPSKDIWKIDELDEVDDVGMSSLQNVIGPTDVQLQNFSHSIYEDHETQQSSEDVKVYIDMSKVYLVSDEAEDFMKLADLET